MQIRNLGKDVFLIPLKPCISSLLLYFFTVSSLNQN
jgi:hypothetical protein